MFSLCPDYDPKRNKFAGKAYECVFVGYAENSKAYRFFDLNAHIVIESIDVDFYEHRFPFILKNSGDIRHLIMCLCLVLMDLIRS